MTAIDRAERARAALAAWESWSDAQMRRRLLAHAQTPAGLADIGVDVAERARAQLAADPGPTALEALEAVTALAHLSGVMRWEAIDGARAAGATWADIGAAIGTTRQRAHQIYSERPGSVTVTVPDAQDHDGGPVPSSTERTAR